MIISLLILLFISLDTYAVVSIIAAIKRRPFKKYLADNFPELKDADFLMAHRFIEKKESDICITIDDQQKRLIILFPGEDHRIAHKIYPFDSLKDVISDENVKWAGKLIQVYKYHNRLILTFNDNASYHFLLSATGRHFKKDKTARHIINLHGNWKQKLKQLLRKQERRHD